MTGRVIAERYQILDTIGKGGMAIVYRAIDLRTGHSVAIKVLRPEFNQDEEFLNRFQREAEAASKVSHHNIVNLLDVGMDGDSRYLVMEYVQGKTLKELIREKGKLAPPIAVQIAIRILSALQHTHQNGIIHRDIKPQNILVQSEGHIKVSDFGIARMANSSTLTKGDSVMGSVHYFSPEQAAGEEVAETSDIYSVGVVLYEMLTGQVPFEGDSPVAVAMQHLHNIARPITELSPEVSPAVAHVVMVAMEKDPRYRYQSALEMATDLKKALNGKEGLRDRKSDSQPIPALRSQTMGDLPLARAAVPVRKKGFSLSPKAWQRFQVTAKWVVTILTAGMVFFGLYMGGMAIYKNLASMTKAPDLVGQDIATALRLSERAELKTEVLYLHHATIPSGVVILQTPEYDTQMRKGDTIVLNVSDGPAVQSVPNLYGMSSADAAQSLQSLGLILTVTENVMSTEPVGAVLRQTPEAGQPFAPGSSVQVVLSGGSAIVPNLSNATLPQAQEAILQSGLVLGAVEQEEVSDPAQNGLVIAQEPSVGAQVILGAAVKLTVAESESRRHQATITLKIPKTQAGVHVRVTLVGLAGEETEEYAAMHAADSGSSPEVTLYSDMPGVMTYRVYFDGALSYEDTVTLN